MSYITHRICIDLPNPRMYTLVEIEVIFSS